MQVWVQLGPQQFACEAPDSSLLRPLEGHYRDFVVPARDGAVAASRVRFFVDPARVEGWRHAEQLLESSVWQLRRGRGRMFVVRTAFRPPKPLWVAAADPALSLFEVAQLPLDERIPGAQVVDSGLLILLRLAVMHQLLAPPSGLLVHSAGVVVAGRALLLAGVSGAGKSTISRLVVEHGAGEVVNDDRMLLTREDQAWTAWGTPWPGELGIARNRQAPLTGVVFLEKCDRTRVERVAPQDALRRILPLVSVPLYDATLVGGALELLEDLVRQVPVHVLHFRPDASAADAVAGIVGA